MIHKKIQKLVFGVISCSMMHLGAFVPLNLFAPYDRFIMPEDDGKAWGRVGVNGEFGCTHRSYNTGGDRDNILRVHNATESTVNMIRNPVGVVANNVDTLGLIFAGLGVTDVVGNLQLSGKLEEWDVTPQVGYCLPFDCIPGKLFVNAYLPVRHAAVKGISIKDLTDTTCVQGNFVHNNLSGDIANKVKAFSGLDLSSWEETGLGDMAVTLDWHNHYPQNKENLKDVILRARLGVSIPTASERDENKAFSVALGNDGAWGIPLGVGIDLDFIYRFRCGANVDFMILFDKTKTRRLKTHVGQTDFLLLNKGSALKDHGLTWKFDLYLQTQRCWNGFSAKVAYQYFKHDDDRLSPRSDDFDYGVVNTAASLTEYNMHHILFQAGYDFFTECAIRPSVSMFYKLPVAGRSSVAAHTFGAQIMVNF